MFSGHPTTSEEQHYGRPLQQIQRLTYPSKTSYLAYFVNVMQKAVGYGPANYAQVGERVYCCRSRHAIHLTDRLILSYINSIKHGRRLVEARRFSAISSREASFDMSEAVYASHYRLPSLGTTTMTSQHPIIATRRRFSEGHRRSSRRCSSFSEDEEDNDQLEAYYSDAYLAQKAEKIAGGQHRGHYRVFDVRSSTQNIDTYATLTHVDMTTLSIDSIMHLSRLVGSYLKSDNENVAIVNIGARCTAAVAACLLLYLYPTTMTSSEAKKKYQSMIKSNLFVREGSGLRMVTAPSELRFIEEFANYLKRRNQLMEQQCLTAVWLDDIVLSSLPKFDTTCLSLMCMVCQGNEILHNSLLKDRGLKQVSVLERDVKFTLRCIVTKDAWIRIYHRPDVDVPKLICEIHIHPYLLDPHSQQLNLLKDHLDGVKSDNRFSDHFRITICYRNADTIIEKSDMTELTSQSDDDDDNNSEEPLSDQHHFTPTVANEEHLHHNGESTEEESQQNTLIRSSYDPSSLHDSNMVAPGTLQALYNQVSITDTMARGSHGALPTFISQLPTSRYYKRLSPLSSPSDLSPDECQICKSSFTVSVIYTKKEQKRGRRKEESVYIETYSSFFFMISF
jgi:hypothetical protein